MKAKCIILLSSKCAGSSAFQSYLIKNFGVSVLAITPHQENETLFWTKAASALNMPQQNLHRSVVPYSCNKGRAMLEDLLIKNDVKGVNAEWNKERIFESFEDLVIKNGPVFFEKSPHHLFNQSNIDLMLDATNHLSHKIDFYFVGLIRNPMDTIYSAWKRWRFHCKSFEREWYQSYSNLMQLTKKGIDLTVFRYEHLATSTDLLDDFMRSKINIQKSSSKFRINSKSISMWKTDNRFSHQLTDETKKLAKAFGYLGDSLDAKSRSNLLWVISEGTHSVKYIARKINSRFNKL